MRNDEIYGNIKRRFSFGPTISDTPSFTIGDGIILLGIIALLYAGIRLAFNAPDEIAGPDISLSLSALPWYALLSVWRMAAAYCLSLVFSLIYGYVAARNRTARLILIPMLDILQSVPILSFLPVVLLGMTAVLPQRAAVELSAIFLIFTSQAWNMTFSFYQSLTTIPNELHEAAAVFRFNPWLRFKTLELPFSAIGLLWNSMMSWSGGWFFLMAAEIFHVGYRDFRLPGLGSYLQTAAAAGNIPAILFGLGTLILIIILLDQFVWRPLLAWSDKFKVEMTEEDEPPESWFLDLISRAWLLKNFGDRIWQPLIERFDSGLQQRLKIPAALPGRDSANSRPSRLIKCLFIVFIFIILYFGYKAVEMMLDISASQWFDVGVGLLATFARVTVSLFIALLWTVPLGVAIGTNRRFANIVQPIVQILASVPATALFPILLIGMLKLPQGLELAAILLMLMGTQWYLLFNVIAGAAAIPQDLRSTTNLMSLSSFDRWRILILPALFPYIITGAITAGGGAWNASIVAENFIFGGRTHSITGIGSIIADATGNGNNSLLLAATTVLVVTVVIVNRIFWLKLYHLAEEKYRME